MDDPRVLDTPLINDMKEDSDVVQSRVVNCTPVQPLVEQGELPLRLGRPPTCGTPPMIHNIKKDFKKDFDVVRVAWSVLEMVCDVSMLYINATPLCSLHRTHQRDMHEGCVGGLPLLLRDGCPWLDRPHAKHKTVFEEPLAI